jgi:hypothetical protein
MVGGSTAGGAVPQPWVMVMTHVAAANKTAPRTLLTSNNRLGVMRVTPFTHMASPETTKLLQRISCLALQSNGGAQSSWQNARGVMQLFWSETFGGARSARISGLRSDNIGPRGRHRPPKGLRKPCRRPQLDRFTSRPSSRLIWEYSDPIRCCSK